MAARFMLELGRTEQRLAWAEVAAWKQLAYDYMEILQEQRPDHAEHFDISSDADGSDEESKAAEAVAESTMESSGATNSEVDGVKRALAAAFDPPRGVFRVEVGALSVNADVTTIAALAGEAVSADAPRGSEQHRQEQRWWATLPMAAPVAQFLWKGRPPMAMQITSSRGCRNSAASRDSPRCVSLEHVRRKRV